MSLVVEVAGSGRFLWVLSFFLQAVHMHKKCTYSTGVYILLLHLSTIIACAVYKVYLSQLVAAVEGKKKPGRAWFVQKQAHTAMFAL